MGGRTSVSPLRCEHHSPVLIERAGDECFGQCLLCKSIGPIRKTPKEAWRALVNQGHVPRYAEVGSGKL